MRIKNNRKGNGAVEFALGFSLLWACFSGVFQYGYSMYIYNSLQAAVTDGAAYASRANVCKTGNSFRDGVRGVVVYGNPAVNAGAARVPNLTPAHVEVLRTPTDFPTSVTIRVTNYTVTALFQTVTFANKPTVTMPFVGTYQTGGC